jgi:microcystin-dependent protein
MNLIYHFNELFPTKTILKIFINIMVDTNRNLSKMEFIAKIEPTDLLIVNRHSTDYKIKANNFLTTTEFIEKINGLNEAVEHTKQELTENVSKQIQSLALEKKRKFADIDNRISLVIKEQEESVNNILATLNNQLSSSGIELLQINEANLNQKLKEEKDCNEKAFSIIYAQLEKFVKQSDVETIKQEFLNKFEDVHNNIQRVTNQPNIEQNKLIATFQSLISKQNEEKLEEIVSFKQDIENVLSTERSSLLENISKQNEEIEKISQQTNKIKNCFAELEYSISQQFESIQNTETETQKRLSETREIVTNLQLNHGAEISNLKKQLEDKDITIKLIQDQLQIIFENQNNFLKKSELPPGTIAFWPTENIPEFWSACEGQLLNKEEYPELFQILQYKFGGKENHFNLPNTRGQFIRCWNSQGVRAIGSYQQDSIREHKHTFIQSSKEEKDSSTNLETLNGVAFNLFETAAVASPQFSEQKMGFGPTFNIDINNPGYIDCNEGPFVSIGYNVNSEKETRPSNIAFVCCIKIK